MTKDKLTENDRRLASAWIDQELPESDRDYIEARLVGGDEALKQLINEFRFSRAEFRNWFETEFGESSRKIDCWAKIQRELRAAPPSSWLERLQDYIREHVRVVSVGAVGVTALFAIFLASTPRDRGPIELAQKEALEIERLQDQHTGGGNQQIPLVLAGVSSAPVYTQNFTPSAKDLPLSLPVPDALAVKLLSSPQLIVGNDVQGGFRAGETDIEWIKSDRPFRLVSPKKVQSPPVIWVASRRR